MPVDAVQCVPRKMRVVRLENSCARPTEGAGKKHLRRRLRQARYEKARAMVQVGGARAMVPVKGGQCLDHIPGQQSRFPRGQQPRCLPAESQLMMLQHTDRHFRHELDWVQEPEEVDGGAHNQRALPGRFYNQRALLGSSDEVFEPLDLSDRQDAEKAWMGGVFATLAVFLIKGRREDNVRVREKDVKSLQYVGRFRGYCAARLAENPAGDRSIRFAVLMFLWNPNLFRRRRALVRDIGFQQNLQRHRGQLARMGVGIGLLNNGICRAFQSFQQRMQIWEQSRLGIFCGKPRPSLSEAKSVKRSVRYLMREMRGL
jgi:hypothetical protein